MSESAKRTVLTNLLNSVTGIGVVHDYDRWCNTWDEFLTLFKPTGQSYIRGWSVTCNGWTEESFHKYYTEGRSCVRRAYSYIIRGYFSLDDSAATEKTFAALAESVMQKLDGSKTLHPDTPDDDPEIPYAQLRVLELRMFGGVLCHYAEINQIIREDVVITRS
jgi:hypothetical protein